MEQAVQHAFGSKHLWDLIPADPFKQPYTQKQCRYILSMLESFTKLWVSESSAQLAYLRLRPNDPNSTVPETIARLAKFKLDYWLREARDVQEAEVQEMGKEISAYFEGTPNVVPGRPFALLVENEKAADNTFLIECRTVQSFCFTLRSLTMYFFRRNRHQRTDPNSRSSSCRRTEPWISPFISSDARLRRALCWFQDWFAQLDQMATTSGEFN